VAAFDPLWSLWTVFFFETHYKIGDIWTPALIIIIMTALLALILIISVHLPCSFPHRRYCCPVRPIFVQSKQGTGTNDASLKHKSRLMIGKIA